MLVAFKKEEWTTEPPFNSDILIKTDAVRRTAHAVDHCGEDFQRWNLKNQVPREIWRTGFRYRTLHTRADLCLSLELVEKMMKAVETENPVEIDQIAERRSGILEQALEKQTGRRLRRSRRPTN